MSIRKPNIVPINDHVWLLDDHVATCYVVAGKKKAMIIDTSVGICNIKDVAQSLTQLPLICVNTHGHIDHVGGNWSFDCAYMNLLDLPTAYDVSDDLRSKLVRQGQSLLNQQSLKEILPPFINVEDGQVFDLGDLLIKAIHFPGHTPGSIVLLDEQDKALFAGDGIVEQLWLQLPESLSVKTQIASMEKLRPLRDSFDKILHGHAQNAFGIELYDTMYEALCDHENGNTEGDFAYEWHGHTSMAHPYCSNKRCIVYKQNIHGLQ